MIALYNKQAGILAELKLEEMLEVIDSSSSNSSNTGEEAELEKEVKSLKQQIRDAKKEEKVVAGKTEEYPCLGYGAFLTDQNRFIIAELKFDPVSKGAVVSDLSASMRGASEAVRKAQIKLGKHITDLNRGR